MVLLLWMLQLGIWGCSSAQRPNGRQVPVKPEGIQRIALDELGQLYVVTQRNDLLQYRADGSAGFHYNNNTLGTLGLVDATNPFTILLYYPDFQTIVLLDRTLNEKTRIRLSELNLLDVQVVALSNDNFIWLYDAADAQLKKLDQEGNISFRSDRLDLLLRAIPRPDRLLAEHNRLILHDASAGIFLFDQFGRYETTLPLPDATDLQLPDDQTLIYRQEGDLHAFDLRSLQDKKLEVDLPCRQNCHLHIGNGRLYWLEAGALRQQKFP